MYTVMYKGGTHKILIKNQDVPTYKELGYTLEEVKAPPPKKESIPVSSIGKKRNFKIKNSTSDKDDE